MALAHILAVVREKCIVIADDAQLIAARLLIAPHNLPQMEWTPCMPDLHATLDAVDQRQCAISRWDNEGGANEHNALEASSATPVMTNTELVHLHIRVIALETVFIAVLAEGTEKQREVAQYMAKLIAPGQGSTPHALTTQAAKHVEDLVERAVHLQAVQS